MNLNIKNINNLTEVATIISSSILYQLEAGKRVLLFLSGGSAIPLEVEVSRQIKKFPHANLVVTLADERFGLLNNPDSNWFKLMSAGFDLPEARGIPFLTGDKLLATETRIHDLLEIELNKANYKIAILGFGIDGHTAGIFPHTKAVTAHDVIFSYETEPYHRITITPRVIESLDEIVVFAEGEDKWPIISALKDDISIDEQPAQLFKKVPLLTIYSDYKE